jgi:hypothetical protein
MMRPATGLNAHLCRRQLLKEPQNLAASQLSAQHRLLGAINSMQLKNTLGRVHTNADKIVHGRSPLLEIFTNSFWRIRCRREAVHTNIKFYPREQHRPDCTYSGGHGFRRDDGIKQREFVSHFNDRPFPPAASSGSGFG